jgi:hypothetical protein
VTDERPDPPPRATGDAAPAPDADTPPAPAAGSPPAGGGGGPAGWRDEHPPDLVGDRLEVHRARELAPYRRRDAGLYDSGLTDRYPGLRGSGTRDPRIRSSGPGPGAGTDQDPDRSSMLSARIALVAAIVVGQLWALTVMLDSWHERDDGQVWLLLAFQVISFVLALIVWRASPTER